jgi:hypothetical protein
MEVRVMKLRRIMVLLAISLLAIPLVACGGDDGVTETTAAATATTAAAGSAAAERTVTVASSDLLQAIAAGAEGDAVVRPLTGWVVSSANTAGISFVVMEFSGSMENYLGLWATDDPEGAGTFWAVNDVAKDSTKWADGDDADPKISIDDAGAKEALAKFNVQ